MTDTNEDILEEAKKWPMESHNYIHEDCRDRIIKLIQKVERLKKFEWMYEASKDDQATVIGELTRERDNYLTSREQLMDAVKELSKEIKKLEEDLELLNHWKLEVKELKAKVSSLFDKIKHGDLDHQAWLRDTIWEHFK